MILENSIVGKYTRLRTAEGTDASFALNLRLNPKLNQFLKPVDPSVEKQAAWIESKKTAIGDYHMVIEDLKGTPLGIVAVYDIDIEQRSFDWGRWIVDLKAPIQASIESMILVYDFAFKILQLEKTRFEVRLGNTDVINLHKRYARSLHQDEHFQYFEFTDVEYASSNFLNRFKNKK
jgi:RimJ/RimL family protein N-acetyltransferase